MIRQFLMLMLLLNLFGAGVFLGHLLTINAPDLPLYAPACKK